MMQAYDDKGINATPILFLSLSSLVQCCSMVQQLYYVVCEPPPLGLTLIIALSPQPRALSSNHVSLNGYLVRERRRTPRRQGETR